MPDRPSGTVTFLFGDIEGSTRLLRELGAERYRAVLESERRIIRAEIAEHGGSEVDSQGDAFFAAFWRAADATRAAAGAQRVLADQTWPDGRQVRVRMAVHTSEAMPTQDGYVGMGVHRGARICAAAHGGQVLISQTTSELLVEDELRTTLRDLGEYRLKDFSEPQRLFQLLDPALADRFPMPRVPKAAVGIGALRRAAAPMVGREQDAERLRGALASAAAGDPRVVLVAGEAGIGKTRLLTELAAEMRATGGQALVGGCLDLADGGLPFLPLAEAMRGLAATMPSHALGPMFGPARAQLARLVPALGNDDGTEEPLAAGRLFEGILGLLGRLGKERPTLLAFEDVHWIDRASRDLVTFLARNLSSESILLVLTCRTDDLSGDTAAWIAHLSRQPLVERLELERLSRADVGRQLTAILGETPDAELVERAWRRSDGNPYFVEELATVTSDRPPQTVVELLTARLSVLSPRTREVVRIVAAGGRSMDEELLVAVADRPIGQVRAALREAIDHRILVATSHSRRLGFRHALVREVAADELLAGEQAGLHERLAMVLSARPELAEASPAGAAAELAYHWEAAGRSAEALAAAIEAGAAAARVAAWADADRQYQRALRLIDRTDQLPDGIDRIELLRRSGEAAELDGEPARAQGIIEQALGEIDAGVDAVRAGLLQGRLGYLRWVQGDNDAALAAHLRAVELVPAEPSSAARARVLASLGGALLGFGRYDDSRLTCEEAIRCAQAVGARSEEARARNMLGSDLVALGDVEGGLAELERSRDLAIAAGPSDMRVVGHYNLAVNLALAGRLRDAEVAARQGAEAARTEGLQRRYGMDLAALEGDVLMRLGRWADANRVIDEGIGLDPNGRGTIYLAIVRGRLDALRGDTDAARSWFGIAEDLAAGQMDADLAGFLARAQAELALVDERPQDALRICVDGIAPLAGTNDHFVRSPLLALAIQSAAELAEGARVAQDAAQLARARATAEPLVEELRGMAVREGGPMISALAGVAEAEWSRLIGEPADALWSAAAPALEAISDPYAVAYVSYRRAESELRRRGVRADVSDSLRSAALLAAGLGARPLLRSVEHLARRARVHLAEQTRTGPAADDRSRPSRSTNSLVSARELEVLRLVAAGRTNGEIADELFISRKTASVHVTHILDKLGVANRVEAAMAATRLGLLNDEWSTPAPHRRRRPPAS